MKIAQFCAVILLSISANADLIPPNDVIVVDTRNNGRIASDDNLAIMASFTAIMATAGARAPEGVIADRKTEMQDYIGCKENPKCIRLSMRDLNGCQLVTFKVVKVGENQITILTQKGDGTQRMSSITIRKFVRHTLSAIEKRGQGDNTMMLELGERLLEQTKGVRRT